MQNKQPLSNLIYEYFLLRLRFGYYKLGDTLPLVGTLCEEFSVSENTVKSALRRLRAEGYLDMRRGQATTVLFQQSEQEYRDYIAGFYAKRRAAHSDLYASAELLFVPMMLEGLRRMSGGELDALSRLCGEAEPDDLLQFYFLLLHRLHNSLVMNLFWEALFFWGVPFSRREGRPAQYTAEMIGKRMERLTAGARSQSWESVHDALIEYQREDASTAANFLVKNVPLAPKEEQIPFVWRIYRDHPQIYYGLSVRLLHEIYIGSYRNQEYLPSYAAMAEEYGASISTIRRTIATLYSLGAVEPVNGKGIRICPIGKPCKSVDFSDSAIRRTLSFYVQGFDMIKLTCEDVTRNHISTLSSELRKNLIDQLEEERRSGHCIVSIFHFLRSIADDHRLQAVRQVYEILYGLFLWGVPLLKGTSKKAAQLSRMSERFTEQMLRSLRKNDVEGCVAAAREVLDGQYTAAEHYLSRQGLSMEDLRLSSTIQFSVTGD